MKSKIQNQVGGPEIIQDDELDKIEAWYGESENTDILAFHRGRLVHVREQGERRSIRFVTVKESLLIAAAATGDTTRSGEGSDGSWDNIAKWLRMCAKAIR